MQARYADKRATPIFDTATRCRRSISLFYAAGWMPRHLLYYHGHYYHASAPESAALALAVISIIADDISIDYSGFIATRAYAARKRGAPQERRKQ